MTILTLTRGLGYDVLDTICKLIKSNSASAQRTPSPVSLSSCDLNDPLLYKCLSEPIHLQCLMSKPSIAKIFLNFVRQRLDDGFDDNMLQKFIKLLDPSSVLIRPIVARLFECYKLRQMKSLSICSDSYDASEPVEATVSISTILKTQNFYSFFFIRMIN